MNVPMSIAAAKAEAAGSELRFHRSRLLAQVCMHADTAFIARLMSADHTTEKAVIKTKLLCNC